MTKTMLSTENNCLTAYSIFANVRSSKQGVMVMRLLAAAMVFSFIGWFVMDHNDAMETCQQNHSYGTCLHNLR